MWTVPVFPPDFAVFKPVYIYEDDNFLNQLIMFKINFSNERNSF